MDRFFFSLTILPRNIVLWRSSVCKCFLYIIEALWNFINLFLAVVWPHQQLAPDFDIRHEFHQAATFVYVRDLKEHSSRTFYPLRFASPVKTAYPTGCSWRWCSSGIKANVRSAKTFLVMQEYSAACVWQNWNKWAAFKATYLARAAADIASIPPITDVLQQTADLCTWHKFAWCKDWSHWCALNKSACFDYKSEPCASLRA